MQEDGLKALHHSSRSNLSMISSNEEFPTPCCSSENCEWPGILVEQRHLTSGELAVPALPEHFLGLHIRQPQPIQFAQERVGTTTRQAIFREGDVTLLPAGQACLWQQEGGRAEVLQIRLQPALVHAVAEATNLSPERVELLDSFVFQDPHIHSIAYSLLQELQSPGIGGRLFVESQATVLALHLLRRHSVFAPKIEQGREKLPSAKVRHVMDYIHEHLEQDVTLSALAEVVQVSPYHLLRLFKQATGCTPHQYLLSSRLKRVRELLQNTKCSISEIALLTGFADQSHLTRHFKRVFGITPAAFVRERRI